MRTILLFLATAVLAVAMAAERYTVTLFQPSVVGETELQPGDYNLKVEGNQVIFKQGKKTVQAEVKIESGDKKFRSTRVRYKNVDGKYRISEIRLGGTTRTLTFN